MAFPFPSGQRLRRGVRWILALALFFPTLAWGPGIVRFEVTVDLAGNGSGVVTGEQFTSESCREDCTILFEIYPGLPPYSLFAAADPGSRFAGWTNCPTPFGSTTCIPFGEVVPCPTQPGNLCSFAAVTATFRRVPAGDANGDLRADLFWREPSGSGVSWWTMDGATVTGGNWLAVGPEWQVKRGCDLTGEGKADLVWQREADGFVHLWSLDGLAVSACADVGAADPSQWSLAGCADLDRDGKSDLLWRGTGGESYAWLMDGGAIRAHGLLGIVDTAWQVAGVADLDREGHDDIVWRHSVTGEAYAWFMDGLAITSQKSLGTLDPAQWTLAAVADFDGDGHADLLWRHTSGDTWAWRMRAGAYMAGASLGTPGPEWSIASVADRDADGKADIAWRHADGSLWLWKLDGLAVASQAPMPNPGASWQVVAP